MADRTSMRAVYYGYTGMIDSQGATRIATAMNMAVNEGGEEVHLCFSSLGGFVADGIYLYNHIRGLPLKVHAYALGTVASIAVAVFLAADERFCSSHAMFMIHPTALPLSENIGAERLQACLAAALADDHRTENILRERAAIPDDILQSRRFTDVYIRPDQALEWSLVQRVREFTLPKGHQILQI